ncbi:hypothetical protein CVT26_011228 [Gymnopilus dilepis]|uniref:Uncharacterized protein n=1 Tax=Gymnopilus dilepis TaxID=231916 RepID=A0A409WRI7_9AGAR|nr:hypothetical protein CVT26_011228 [Gymnopilus dilepis]
MLPPVAHARFNNLIEDFGLGDPVSLRREMVKYNSIISGSAALLVFHPGAFTPGDLDFYVPAANAANFKAVLKDRGFFDNCEDNKRPYYPSSNLLTTCRFWKEGLGRSVNLITIRGDNPLVVVVQFHSTLLMNVITGHGVVCLYPLLTLPGRGLIMVDTMKARKCLVKYGRRGFRFQTVFASHQCDYTGYCRNATRSIDDKDVLTVPFEYQPQSANTSIAGLTPFQWRLGPIRM